MVSLKMGALYKFDAKTVNEKITQTKPGNYALGELSDEDTFIPRYVGRSDSDVRCRIKDHLDEGYLFFKFSYAASPRAAFEKECNNYHDFIKQLHNEHHPARPDHSPNWKCPYPGCNK